MPPPPYFCGGEYKNEAELIGKDKGINLYIYIYICIDQVTSSILSVCLATLMISTI